MPLQATSGAASYDAFGGGVPVVPAYIEEVFQTWLYAGNGSSQTITNGIDLSTKGGLVWIKSRQTGSNGNAVHSLYDTQRGVKKRICSELTNAEFTYSTTGVTAFGTTGFSIADNTNGDDNVNGAPGGIYAGTNALYASWTFRKQPKFFDVVTYTGTGSNTTIAHSLGSVPGSIIVKRTDTTGAWQVYHRSLANTEYLVLNTTAMKATGATRWNSTTPTSTVFSLGTDATVNASGGTYVAYIFAHDAGGFGLTGTDNVISCGSFATNGSGVATVNLGYEPQWLLFKSTVNSTFNWYVIDNMRGWTSNTSGDTARSVYPNVSDGEQSIGTITITPTGFTTNNANIRDSDNYIYIAIRRGPMKVPTSGTSVFGLSARTGTGAVATVTGGQTDDAVIVKNRGSAVASLFASRLTGARYLVTSSTAADVAAGTTILQANPWDVMDGVKVGTTSTITNASGNTFINYFFKRAPSFFDVVCYTGTATAGQTFNHNLGVVPQLMIIKKRSSTASWPVYLSATTLAYLDLTDALYTSSSHWNDTAPTSTVFTLGTSNELNESGQTYVNYLFATCAGVSKVGSYTGNGSTQTIDCGFGAGGARFVLIKRTDSTGGWYVYDTARGMTLLTDPYLFLNTTAAEAATLGSVTTVSTGFALDSTILAAINVSAGTYIFLAIA